jgi:hypothetical protein
MQKIIEHTREQIWESLDKRANIVSETTLDLRKPIFL